jgi:glutamate racemase
MACPLFVPFVEEGWLCGKVVLDVARNYLQPLKDARVDTLILGCTHYPLLKTVIKEIMGGKVALIDSAKQVAIDIKKILAAEGALNTKRRAAHRFYVSDNPEWFNDLAERFLGRKVKDAKKTNSV